MRYLAFFLALAPSFVLAADWKFSWYKDSKCHDEINHIDGNGARKGTLSRDVRGAKFEYHKNGVSGYIYNVDEPNNPLGLSSGSCLYLNEKIHNGWKIQ